MPEPAPLEQLNIGTMVPWSDTEKPDGFTGDTFQQIFEKINTNFTAIGSGGYGGISAEDLATLLASMEVMGSGYLDFSPLSSYFNTDAEGWTVTNGTITHDPVLGKILVESTAANCTIQKDFTAPNVIEGSRYTRVCFEVKHIAGANDVSKLRWKTNFFGYSATHEVEALGFADAEPYAAGDVKLMVFDLGEIADWTSYDITGLQLLYGSGATTDFEVSSVVYRGNNANSFYESAVTAEAAAADAAVQAALAEAEKFAAEAAKDAALLYRDTTEDFKDVTETFKLDSEAAKLAAEAAEAGAEAFKDAAQVQAVIAESAAEISRYKDIQVDATTTFNGVLDSWSATNGTLTTPGPGSGALLTPSGTNPYIQRTGLNFQGSRYNRVIVNVTRISGSDNTDQTLYWSTAGHGFDSLYRAEPVGGMQTLVTNQPKTLVFNMETPVSGGSNWVSSFITGIRIDLTQAGDQVKINYIIVAGPDEAAPYVAATAAAVSALDAEASATEASASAGTATSAKIDAQSAAATATTQASNASASAASASTSSLVSARLSGGVGSLRDPIFAEWAAESIPPGWSNWVVPGGTITKETTLNKYGTQALRMTTTGATDNVGLLMNSTDAYWVGPKLQRYVVAEVDVELISGSFDSSGIYFECHAAGGPQGSTSNQHSFDNLLSAAGLTETTSRVYSFKKVIDLNGAGFDSSTTFIRFYLMAAWTGFGAATSKSMIWHRVQLRQPTAEEVRTFNVAGEIAASVAVETSARVTADGIIEGKYAVKVDVNGYVTGFGLISTGNTASPTSTFSVIADNFLIAKPGVSGGTPTQIFEIGTVDGTPAIVMRGNIFADGTVTGNALAIGGSANILQAGDFSSSENWNISVGGGASGVIDLATWNGTWAPAGESIAWFDCNGVSAAGNLLYTSSFGTRAADPTMMTIDPTKYYEASYYSSTHRGSACYLQMSFYDASGVHLGNAYGHTGYVYQVSPSGANVSFTLRVPVASGSMAGTVVNAKASDFTRVGNAASVNPGSNPKISDWYRQYVIFKPPTSAKFVRFYVIASAPQSPDTQAYYWIARPFFAEARTYQSEPSPWSYGVTTIRDGTITTNKIVAGAITASKISVSTLSAITANIGTITAGLLRSTDSKFQIQLDNKRIVIAD